MRYYATMHSIFEDHLQSATALYELIRTDERVCRAFNEAADLITKALAEGRLLLMAGNGGSAGEAQHFAAEVVGRYKRERKGRPAIALTTDTSALTAIGNDYGFDQIFSRQLEALGRPGDVFIALSTSGNSENLVQAVAFAKSQGIGTIGLLGKGGGTLASLVDVAVTIPSDDTPRIQEAHLLVVHALSELIDAYCAT